MERDKCVQLPRRQRVLVVDDDRAYCEALTRVLLAAGFDAVHACGPGEAIRMLERGQRFDAIVCDVLMPRMNGLELQEVLDEWIPAQADRMVMMSGDHKLLDSIGVPPGVCLKKPFRTPELLDAVRRVSA
jgi:CheY-like chemotaxis protein